MSVYLFTSYSRLYVLYLQVLVCSCQLTVMSHLYFFSLYVFMFHSIYSGLSSLFTCSSLLAGLFPCSCPLAYLSHFCVFQSIYLFQFILWKVTSVRTQKTVIHCPKSENEHKLRLHKLFGSGGYHISTRVT